MTDSTTKVIVVDGLDAYLGAGKSAAQVAADFATPNVGSGAYDSRIRAALRVLVGDTEGSITQNLDELVGVVGTGGTFAKTGNLYSVA